MQKPIQKLLGILLSFVILAGFIPSSFAATDFEPYDATFVISAYYSPLPNQRVYFRGSFEADKRLNGNGTNGADGTQVYPGMLAAPKSYPFGMKIEIPGMGVGAIHDRGGAIVEQGERAIATHDRLDVWMGRGEEGLARALQWGVRTVHAKVYPANHTIAESFTLPTMNAVFIADLSLGDSGDDVQKLQEELKTYGYFRSPVDGFFNEATQKALLGYQLARRIVASADSTGASVLGPQTRESLNAEVFKRTWRPPASLLARTNATSGSGAAVIQKNIAETSRFPTTLSIGDKGNLVRDLQIALTEAGFYECEVNGIYDERMEDCVFDFQEANGVLASRDEFGAGYFGKQTRLTLSTFLDERDEEFSVLVAEKLPSKTFSPDDEGEEVAKLQAGLRELGFFAGEVSDVYDSVTREAVIAFQVSSGTLAHSTSYGAGYFGPKTLTAFKTSLRKNLLAMPSLPTNPEWNRATWVAYAPEFSKSLSLGDADEEVEKLQKTLQKIGYSELEITGEFDEATEIAILDFQIKSEILTSADELGAGYLGPKTREALNALVKKEKIALKEKENSQA
jgi:peptidoglycan hydrolase-like protein with peptidoglycan-binding domain